jgi:Ni,Fe-hydrogenase I large subunit
MPSLAADGFSSSVWSAVIRSYVKALRIRRLTFEASALFAGRAPMVSAYVAGGVTNDTNSGNFAARCDQFKTLMKEVGSFIVREYVPIVLALGALYPNYDNLANATTLNTYYPALWTAGNQAAAGGPVAGNTGWGAGVGNFLAWGAFPNPATQMLAMKGGYKIGAAAVVDLQTGKATSGTASAAVAANLREHIAHSRYDAFPETNGYNTDQDAAYPGAVSRTKPKRGVAAKYSWLKAPRWNGNAMEVGPFARMMVMGVIADGQPLRSTVPGYLAYTKANTGYSGPATPDGVAVGLDPTMIEADVAVALVRAGLAELWLGATQVTSLPATKAAIVAAYTDPSAYIMGTIRNWVVNLQGGLSTIDRLRGRAIESLWLVQQMIGAVGKSGANLTWGSGWIDSLKSATGGTYNHKATPVTGFGFGGTEAPRGALMHFITIDKGKIAKYQCVVPTTWNASPKDASGNNGPMEQAMMNIPFSNVDSHFKKQDGSSGTAKGGVEALRVAQSFDPCIACAVH